jgi:AraC-like DNA-binding protein
MSQDVTRSAGEKSMLGVPTHKVSAWTTRDVAGPEQFDYWQDFICHLFLPMVASPVGSSKQFFADLRWSHFGEIKFVDITAPRQVVRRTRTEILRQRDDSLFVNLQLVGSSTVVQDHRTVTLHPGDLVFMDGGTPYDMFFEDDFRQFVMQFSREELHMAKISPNAFGGLRVDQSNALCELYRHSVWGLSHVAERLNGHERAAAAGMLLNLLSGIMGESLAEEGGGRTAKRLGLLSAVLQFVHMHASDPKLSPTSVAKQFGMAPRTLFQLFEDNAVSFSATLLDTRLARAEHDLRDPRVASQPITTIALSNGFNDLSHFGRAFRQKYGHSPREYRADCLREQALRRQAATRSDDDRLP